MNLLLIFILLQAILRVKFVLNSKIELIEEEIENSFKIDSETIVDNQIIVNTVESQISDFSDSPSPIEISPTSVAFEITKEWIENYLIPTFKADKMISKRVIKKVKKKAEKGQFFIYFLDYKRSQI